jgi:hypothetical protein
MTLDGLLMPVVVGALSGAASTLLTARVAVAVLSERVDQALRRLERLEAAVYSLRGHE